MQVLTPKSCFRCLSSSVAFLSVWLCGAGALANEDSAQAVAAEATEGDSWAETSSDPEEVAAEAATIHAEHCGDVTLRDVRKAAGAVAAAAPIWGRLDQTYRDSGHSYLLYWRGLFAECIGQPERALEDLLAYVNAAEDETDSKAMVAQAKTRIRRLGRGNRSQAGPGLRAQARMGGGTSVAPGATAAGLLAGGSMSGAAVFFGVASAVAWSSAVELAEAELYDQPNGSEDLNAILQNGDQMALDSRLNGGVAVGLGVGAFTAFMITALANSQGKMARVAWGLAPGHPRNPGLSLSFGGRW